MSDRVFPPSEGAAPGVDPRADHGGYPISRRRILQLAAAAAAAGGTAGFWQPVYAAEPHAGGAFSAERFARPAADSMPLILWFWNGTVTTDLVDATLADLRDKGVTEVLVFPFDTTALQPAFFTEAWFAIVEHTLREAESHGMRVWLFNDDFFPSGRAGGFVVNGGTVGDRTYQPRPDLRTKGVTRSSTQVSGGTTVPLTGAALSVADGRLVVDAGAYDGVRVLKDGTGWTDYTVTATVRIESGTAGLMVRCADPLNGYLADLRADGGIDLWRQTGGAFSLLRQGAGTPGFDPGADHTFQVTVSGDRITPSLDGTALAPVTDATFATGTVGVRATATQRSSWDAITVTGADGGQLFTDTFDAPSSVDDFATPGNLGVAFAASARPAGATGGTVPRMIDLTGAVTGDGTWTAPDGDWQVDVFTWHLLADSGGSRRNYLDLLDDEAVSLFMDIVPGEYVRRFPWAVGRVLLGFADDEPFIASADAEWDQVPWSPSLAGEIDRLGGKPGLGVVLSAVHDDLGEQGSELRGVFWRAVSNRFSSGYYKGVGQWMGRHGLDLISNPLWDEYGPAEQVRSTGNLNSAHQWAQVPGTDLISNQYQVGYYRTLPRWPASSAHQMGRDRVYLEAMGATGWQVTPAFTREVIGAFVVRGINKVLLHARFSDEGDIIFAPPFQPVNPWWDLSVPLNEWIGRLVEAARATPAARTALLQPQRAAEAFQDSPQQTAIDDAFLATVHALEDSQIDFDLVDEGALTGDPALLAHARPHGGELVVGQQRYGVVVVPQAPLLSLGAVTTLGSFVDGGGSLVVVGDLPAQEAAGRDAALARATAGLFTGARASHAHRADDPVSAAALVVAAGGAAATVSPPTPELRVLRLDRDGEQSFLLNNEHAGAVEVTATFPALGVPQLCDPDTGDVAAAGVWRAAPFPGRPGGGTAVSLRLEAKAAVLVVFRDAGPALPAHAVESTAPVERLTVKGNAATATVRVSAPGTVRVVAQDGGRRFAGSLAVTDPLTGLPLDGDWSFRFDTDGAQPSSGPLGSWTGANASYSGSAVYERHVTLDAATLAGRVWTLDLGEVRDVAEITVNGTGLPPRLWAPYRVDVTDALRAGDNVVRVRVTNTGANAHGDPEPSGLLGPVLLRPERLAEVRLPASKS
ncbi:alpha-L-rhamnosidase [Actinacidiphila yanglinensis]|uniref:Alpha-L-rhamnosidase n=1 Tax=Actinacidiphila yanglinensis TaxID=310779 RepID=A0A1H6CTK4_9ACTN|nr:glycosylhydrolase-like jelly roll fold domain-containing protein [Actinacidiphila yanglinensis]SEG75746.1 alpha-L-rhamnosidase [Actinacidiphila yanglinensis]